MDNKLTLKLDQQVIMKAKTYAQKRNTSLSKLIEGYLKKLTNETPKHEEEITPLVKSLSGIIGNVKTDKMKVEYQKHLIKKYGK
jgi:hypothetical protein